MNVVVLFTFLRMEPNDYRDITSQLDVREILRYLNNLGIRNINGEVLKLFITDLKKLIKYDLQQKDQEPSSRIKHFEIVGPERLHSATTFSSRIRSRKQDNRVFCSKECVGFGSRKSDNVRIFHSAPSLSNRKTDEKPTRRACSCVRIATKTETKEEPKSITTSNNLIKVPKPPIKKKSDPVSLYHYYTSLWAKYKPNVPGENNWSDLRWSIRQKMVGNTGSQTSNKCQSVHTVVATTNERRTWPQ